MSTVRPSSVYELAPAFAPDVQGEWFVLHTRSRQEKALADDLKRSRIAYFLPLIEQVRFYGRRKALVDEPLFPGYLFLRGIREHAYVADRTKRVANIIPVIDQDRLDWELRNLSLALFHRLPLDPYPFLQIGRKVRVKSGPFKGLEGFVENRPTVTRLVLTVNMLGRALSLEMDASLMETID